MSNEETIEQGLVPTVARLVVLKAEADTAFWMAKKHADPQVAAAANMRLVELKSRIEELEAGLEQKEVAA